MKKLLIAFLFTGCASTSIYENGRKVFTTQANANELSYVSAQGSTLKVSGLNHSTPTRAGGSAIGTAGTAIVSGITAAVAR